MIPAFLMLFGCTVRVLLPVGASTLRDILANRRQFVVAVNTQAVMAVAYPAYQLLFNSVARSAYELPVFLLLLALKIALKNLVSLDLAELADLIPENIIFTNHFFNAIYLATCMQSASSTFAVSAIIIIDLLETGIALYGIYRSSTRIMKQLRHTIGPSMSEDKLLFAAYLLCHCYGKFTKEERAQVQLDDDNLNVGPSFPPSTNTQSMPTITNVLPFDCGQPTDSRWSTMIQPVGPTRRAAVQVTRSKQSRNVNAITAVPSVQHIASLRKTLATLFTIECMILAEYVEFVIPLLYGNYILMMVHLPSARYHTELTGVNEENVVSTVHMVFLYGLLEFGSFILLMLLLKRGCGLQALYHLAFVLETQMLPIQSKIVGWMLITLGFRVVHFGVDITFQFSWMHDKSHI
ncbi:hypothetical protein GN244_ATG11975 [Phytophthora infestans]|uniref:Transmembrane protein n=1 Tax=Phytophthora infestans TaxID=4787 RepID=A0A833SMG0_PHYIN|nr:hypothetical protein GN244_ATG11975 [Phytophthora infestans]KAF4144639.1 hypothetical protein GN958_ATG06169 [Phytophthora infestans]